MDSGILREDLLTATTGVPQRWRFCAMAIFGRQGHSALWCDLCHNSLNLQASVPSWRPFSSSAAAPFVAPSPSGSVPGDGADGRCVELFFPGGEGPDCVPKSLVEVLFVKVKGLLVFSFFFENLDVIFMPTV